VPAPAIDGERMSKMMPRDGRRLIVAALAVLVLLAVPASPEVRAEDRVEPKPEIMEGVGLAPVLGVQLPLEAEFRDERDRKVKLGDYFDGEKPVVFVLIYMRCPMLCGLVLNGVVEGMKGLKWTPGEEFRVVAMSFDPLERPVLARKKKQSLVAEYGRPESANGWTVLTGKPKAIEAVTSRLGYHFKWVEETKEYAHPLVVFFFSPDGKLTHYSGGIQYEPAELRRALTEAADGQIGDWGDRFLQWCGHVLDAENPGSMVMRIGAILTLLIIGIFLLIMWTRHRRAAAAAAPSIANDAQPLT